MLLVASAHSQTQSNPGDSQTPQPATVQPAQTDHGAFTFHVTTREVVVDLIALSVHAGPVSDLVPADLQVSYSGTDPARKFHLGHAPRLQIAPITSLHVVDANALLSSSTDPQTGFRINASCLERSTLHYQLTFRPGPDGWTSDFHQVSVTTTRRGVRLFYRHRYFVGKTVAPSKPPDTGSRSIEHVLAKDACYYPDTPLSISLRARLIDSGRSDILRYFVAVDAASLTYLTLDSDTTAQPTSIDRHLQIDYGICTFNAAGRPTGFFEASVDRVLTSAEYARALARGFPHTLELHAEPSPALVRVVVRDRATGNLGAIDVPSSELTSRAATSGGPDTRSVSVLNNAPAQDPLVEETAHNLELYSQFIGGGHVIPPAGPIGSFGSVVPTVDSFCGDVYELEQASDFLPDFRELDPIGSLYTHSLDVPDQVFTNTDGIPGVTPRTNLFGIDYHASFWIRNAGDYQFRMISDDGAILWIDDRRLINLDGIHSAEGGSGNIHLDSGLHTIHIPYYQGAVKSVALLLWIRSPGENAWTIFDLRNYAPPAANSR